jgi:hypothetical protein
VTARQGRQLSLDPEQARLVGEACRHGIARLTPAAENIICVLREIEGKLPETWLPKGYDRLLARSCISYAEELASEADVLILLEVARDLGMEVAIVRPEKTQRTPNVDMARAILDVIGVALEIYERRIR